MNETRSVIGPYILGKTLGIGSTGTVLLGTHQLTQKNVAVKVIPKKLMKDPDSKSGAISTTTSNTNGITATKTNGFSSKIEREMSILKIIQHPNVLNLLDVFECEKNVYLILEYVQGGELFDYLVQKKRLTESEALDFFQQIIKGIDYCHRHRICHRDLKPENILLDSNLKCRIADFGMASFQLKGDFLRTSCGSPHYASPEVIRGLQYCGFMADIWSCGVILYALITGTLPFDDNNIRSLLQKVKSGIFAIPCHVSPMVKDLIKRMITVDVDKRITMAQVLMHPWFNSNKPKKPSSIKATSSSNSAIGSCIIISMQSVDQIHVKTLSLLKSFNIKYQFGSNGSEKCFWIKCKSRHNQECIKFKIEIQKETYGNTFVKIKYQEGISDEFYRVALRIANGVRNAEDSIKWDSKQNQDLREELIV